MIYRNDRYGNPLSELGYGCLRFTKNAMGQVDIDKAEKEFLRAHELGVNYYDTAYIYSGNEAAIGQILSRNPGLREEIHLATKLPHYLMKSMKQVEATFQEELKRLQTDNIDYYLMHMVTDIGAWEKMVNMGIVPWIEEKKKSGQIRQIGFSFHGSSDMFLKVLDAYDWDFCQIQYNYMDEHSQAGRRGLEAARSKGIPVIIMEPLRGGRLISLLPKGAKDIFAGVRHDSPQAGPRAKAPQADGQDAHDSPQAGPRAKAPQADGQDAHDSPQAGSDVQHDSPQAGVGVPQANGQDAHDSPQAGSRAPQDGHLAGGTAAQGSVWSPAEWGLRWLWDQEGVTVVLSGMNSLEMVEENCRIASIASPGCLRDEDRRIYEAVKTEISRTLKVPCTGCSYCMPCPHGVDIPGAFRAWNEMYSESKKSGRTDYFRASILRHRPTSASLCVKCGRCERHCPQNIRIRDMLQSAAHDLETPWYKAARVGVRLLHLW